MENKAANALKLIAKRLSIPEDKIEDITNPNEDICKAKMQDGKYLIYSWHVPEETFVVVNITNTDAGVGCSLGPYGETEASLDRIVSEIKAFKDKPEESVAYMTGRVFSALFRERVVSDIPRSDEKGVGLLELHFSRVVSLKGGQNTPINVYIVVTLRKQDSLTYQISYSNPYFKSELIKADDHESLCNAIVSKIKGVYLLSKHELDPSTFVTIKNGLVQS